MVFGPLELVEHVGVGGFCCDWLRIEVRFGRNLGGSFETFEDLVVGISPKRWTGLTLEEAADSARYDLVQKTEFHLRKLRFDLLNY